MPYKPTGNPPGRPRKGEVKPSEPEAVSYQEVAGEAGGDIANPPKTLSRAREGFRRVHPDPTEGLYSLPRYGARRRQHVGKRPILHPNVIVKAE